jgi:FkbM family methyltransferase
MADASWKDLALSPVVPDKLVAGDRLVAFAGWIQRVVPRGKGYFPRLLGRFTVPSGPDKRLYLETRHGVRMLITPRTLDVFATMLEAGRSWDYHDFEIFLGLSTPGSVLYDLGANAGYESLEFARVRGEGTRVYTFEPLDMLAQAIADGAAVNRLDVNVFAALVGDRDAEVPFYQPTSGSTLTGSAIADMPGKEKGQSLKRMVSLDGLVYAHGMEPPDVLKIDVESAEHLVFKGAHRLFRETRPHIFMEYVAESDEARQTRTAVEALMADTGAYRLYGYPRAHLQDRFAGRLFELTDDAQWAEVHGLVLRSTARSLSDATIFDQA